MSQVVRLLILNHRPMVDIIVNHRRPQIFLQHSAGGEKHNVYDYTFSQVIAEPVAFFVN